MHLTDQVRDEFKRNREAKITDAIKRFKEFSSAVQLPSFMKGYEEYEKLEAASKKFQKLHADLLKKAAKDIKTNNLVADHLIGDIFKKAHLLKTTPMLYAKAERRMAVGNPPGKNGSIGDAINWLLLVEHIPKGQDLYIVSDDSDFYSDIDKQDINPFLADEWADKKKSKTVCYKTLGGFLKDHFAGVTLSFDPQKKVLIDALENSGSFAATHAIVAQMEEYKYFSLQEAKALLDAAHINSQFGWIVGDPDVKDLILRATTPHKKFLKESHYKEIIKNASSTDA